MSWLKVSDQELWDARLVEAGAGARDFRIRAQLYMATNETAGWVTHAAIRMLDPDGNGPALAQRLAELGLWEAREGGYFDSVYMEHNDPERIAALKAARKQAGKLGGQSSVSSRQQTYGTADPHALQKQTEANEKQGVEANAEANKKPSPSPSPSPSPYFVPVELAKASNLGSDDQTNADDLGSSEPTAPSYAAVRPEGPTPNGTHTPSVAAVAEGQFLDWVESQTSLGGGHPIVREGRERIRRGEDVADVQRWAAGELERGAEEPPQPKRRGGQTGEVQLRNCARGHGLADDDPIVLQVLERWGRGGGVLLSDLKKQIRDAVFERRQGEGP